MSTVEQSGNPARALEITATLSGRRFGLCGFDGVEAERVSRIICGINSLAFVFDESLLSESARICDGMVIKLAGLGPEAQRAAAISSSPILVTASSQSLLQGTAAAYGWPRDFINEPWSDAELLVRLFRLLGPPGGARAVATGKARVDPLVLVADDDPDLTALVEATLRNDGISCRTTDNGLTALRMAREIVPDLVLLDVRMPGINGFEVLETIRHDPGLQTLPVILLTGCDDPADVVRGSELHADQYIAKPVSPNVLLNRVKRLLSTHSRSAARWTRAPSGASVGGKGVRRWSLDRDPRAGAPEQA
jgi:CheY-like chemotaxis protein